MGFQFTLVGQGKEWRWYFQLLTLLSEQLPSKANIDPLIPCQNPPAQISVLAQSFIEGNKALNKCIALH